ncbi:MULTISPECIES: 1-phosphofructokinase [unclassified Microbacterium]|uniref:1-phosphofructokinase n=1 Tax=unclassified Microbacterium TaxID=2609290 RepID=UPI00214B71EC|nr:MULTISPECIES: 1-phosphofructokinase [unclassified Microbacterium]MCR2809331.1 1-phosphofructokinase [Microbacterium sp. zg.B185]WIM20471.1 1-phosphofructokinase [Microbacterium sp. zg-B185]
MSARAQPGGRIVTVTANPSLDRTITLCDTLRPGEVQAAASAREDAGGKGINVARVIAAAGIQTLAVLPLASDDPFAAVLRSSGVTAHAVQIDGHVRANLTITDPAGVTTKLNLPGAPLSAQDATALIAAVVAASEGAAWLVLAGSLPPGVGVRFYVDVIRAVRRRWGAQAPRVAVDTSGAALRAVVDEAAPDLIKPNEEELAELAGIALADRTDLAAAVLPVARALVPARVAAALVTLGAEGAVLVTADGAWQARQPPIRVVSTVGAGDSALAGYLIADVDGPHDWAGDDPAERLRRAVRYGAAAASLPGTQAPSPQDLPAGEVLLRAL